MFVGVKSADLGQRSDCQPEVLDVLPSSAPFSHLTVCPHLSRGKGEKGWETQIVSTLGKVSGSKSGFPPGLERSPFSPRGVTPHVRGILGLRSSPGLRLCYHDKEFMVLRQVLWRLLVLPGCVTFLFSHCDCFPVMRSRGQVGWQVPWCVHYTPGEMQGMEWCSRQYTQEWCSRQYTHGCF